MRSRAQRHHAGGAVLLLRIPGAARRRRRTLDRRARHGRTRAVRRNSTHHRRHRRHQRFEAHRGGLGFHRNPLRARGARHPGRSVGNRPHHQCLLGRPALQGNARLRRRRPGPRLARSHSELDSSRGSRARCAPRFDQSPAISAQSTTSNFACCTRTGTTSGCARAAQAERAADGTPLAPGGLHCSSSPTASSPSRRPWMPSSPRRRPIAPRAISSPT